MPDSLGVAGKAPGLADLLDDSGHLNLPAGFSGSVDPSGFRLVSGKGEAPRFAPAEQKAAPIDSDARWSGFGGIVNGCDGAAFAMAIGPGGEVYLGGNFTICGDVPANNIVRFEPGSNAITPLGSAGGNGVDGIVRALAVSGSDLYVGGDFVQANVGAGITVNRVARWNGSAWQQVGSGVGAGVNGTVHALAVSGGDLYVGGFFSQANVGAGISASNLARWNGSVWSVVGSGGGEGASGPVYALAVSGGDLYVGGSFGGVNMGAIVVTERVARWDGSAWSALGSGVGVGTAGTVRALAVSGSDLFVGGSFSQAGGAPAENIARWDGANWSALGSGSGNGTGNVNALAVIDGDLYAGGGFLESNLGESITTRYVARWDGSAWSAVGSDGGNGVQAVVRAMAVSGTDLLVGGDFTRANVGADIIANILARWNGSAWSALGGGSQAVVGSVRALAVAGNDVYVGGSFSAVGDLLVNNIARWDGSAWSAVGSGPGNGVNGGVLALLVSGGDLYVGGGFSEANVGASIAANSIARWDGNAWSALGSGGNGVNGNIRALARIGSDLFVGGNFTQVNVGGDIPANHIARWNGVAWSSLGTGGNGVNDSVNALAVLGGDLYVGGNFTQARVGAPLTTNRIARWNGSNWSAVGSGGGNGLSDDVHSLAVVGTDLYAGGSFAAANLGANVGVNRIARWDGSTWSALGSGAGGVSFSGVFALAESAGSLYVAGRFDRANLGGSNVLANSIARWNGSAWSAMGSGITGAPMTVQALAVANGETLFAGGEFDAAGGKRSEGIARYTLPQHADVDTVTPASTEPSLESSVSGDGRFVVFESLDPKLHAPCPDVPNPAPLCGTRGDVCPLTGPLYVFRLDTTQGCVDLVSLDTESKLIAMFPRHLGKGTGGEEPLGKPSTNANGQLVAFVADATVTAKLWGESKSARAQRQKGGSLLVLLRNMLTGQTRAVGTGAPTVPASPEGPAVNGPRPRVSADGRSVVFTGLRSGSSKPEVLLERANDSGGFDTFCVSCNPLPESSGTAPGDFVTPLDGFSHNPTLSADGTVVAYQTEAKDAAPSSCDNGAGNTSVNLRNMLTGITRTINQPQGTTCQLGSAGKPSIDYSGNLLVFQSNQPLTSDAAQRQEVYLFDARTNQLQQLSVGASGVQVDSDSGEPAISGDGRHAVFTSRAKTGFGPALPPESLPTNHVVVRDLRKNSTKRFSENRLGAHVDGDSYRPAVGYAGGAVLFDSVASNLSTADANGSVSDVFFRANPLAADGVFGSGFE